LEHLRFAADPAVIAGGVLLLLWLIIGLLCAVTIGRR
jgi:hypothetical protein